MQASTLAVHHIGVAVPSIDNAMQFYGNTMGLAIHDLIELPDRQLKVAFVKADNILIELLEPTDPDTPVARFLERRGPGLHHLCFGTPDIREHLRDLKDKGVELIDETPRPGAHGEVAFLQPSAAYGVLVELLQPPPEPAPAEAAEPQAVAEPQPVSEPESSAEPAPADGAQSQAEPEPVPATGVTPSETSAAPEQRPAPETHSGGAAASEPH